MLTTVKTEWIDRLDPDHTYLKQAIRTTLAALLAIIIYRWQSQWSQGYWIILAAAFLMQTRLGDSLKQQLVNILTAGLSAATLAWLVGFMWHSTYALAVFLAITTFATVYVGLLGVSVAITGFFINLFVIMSAGLVATPVEQVERFFMILLGAFLAAFASLLWPFQSLRAMES